jgi:hypothetical protein
LAQRTFADPQLQPACQIDEPASDNAIDAILWNQLVLRMTIEAGVAAFSKERVVGNDHSSSRDEISPPIKRKSLQPTVGERGKRTSIYHVHWLCKLVSMRWQAGCWREVYQPRQFRVGLYGDKTVSTSTSTSTSNLALLSWLFLIYF